MHVYRLPSGRFRVVVQVNGRRRTATAKSKPEAQRLGAQLFLDLGGNVNERVITVAEVIALGDTHLREHWSPAYAADVDAVVARIPDEFLQRRAAEVTPVVISGLYRQLAKAGWSPHRLRRLHEILSTAWNEAVRLEVLATNPFRDARKPERSKRELTIPTHEQVLAIIEAPERPSERLALRLAATTGARRGEIVALQWRDVDLDRATLVIRRSLVYTPATGVTERPTKTGETGHRVIALDLPTTSLLRRHRAEQVERAVANGLPDPVWVFSYDAGVTSWRPDRLTKIFEAARDAAAGNCGTSATRIRLHDLRHYVATTMLQDGEAPLDVAAQLGHSSTSTTLSVYAHYLPGRGRESAERRAARLTR